MREKLLKLLEPAVASIGYELVELEYRAPGRGGLLRIYIDNDAGISLNDCETVSHYVSGILDVEDIIPGQYNLEVSSPGLERPLRTREHFVANVGAQVKLQLSMAQDGRRRFRGELLGMDGGEVRILVDGQEFRLPLANVEKARVTVA